jgi:hypothetical protein
MSSNSLDANPPRTVVGALRRLEATRAEARFAPKRVIEPLCIALSGSAVVEPRVVCVSDVSVRDVPAGVAPGAALTLTLTLRPESVTGLRFVEGLSAVAAALASSIDIEATNEANDRFHPQPALASRPPPELLAYTARPTASSDVSVSVLCPPTAAMGSFIVVHRLCIDGVPLAGPPWVARVTRLMAPLTLAPAADSRWYNARVTPDGMVWALGASDRAVSRDKHLGAFASDGKRLQDKTLDLDGLSQDTAITKGLAYDAGTGTLIIAARSTGAGAEASVLGIAAASMDVLWQSARDTTLDPMGIALLPAQRVFLLCNYACDRLQVRRVGDGALVADARCRCPGYADALAATGTAFVSCCSMDDSDFSVAVWHWSAPRSELWCEPTPLLCAGRTEMSRPLAVMPSAAAVAAAAAAGPSAGGDGRGAVLISATDARGEVRISSLVSRTLLHVHTFRGLDIDGLAADPSGTALVVVAGGQLHVFSWPLPGMPPLPVLQGVGTGEAGQQAKRRGGGAPTTSHTSHPVVDTRSAGSTGCGDDERRCALQ